MRMNEGRQAAGYTFVEVLIFIALTSFLLVIAVSNLNASRSHTQFSQAVRDFESRLADVINDVSTGYFPESSLGCKIDVGNNIVKDTAPIGGLGENIGCIHAGKALQFKPDKDAGKMIIYNLAGRRKAVSGDLDKIEPIVIADPGDASTYSEVTFTNGLQVTRIFDGSYTSPPPGGKTYTVVAILSDFEGSSPASTGSDSQTVDIGVISPTQGNGLTNVQAIDKIDKMTKGGKYETFPEGIVFCLLGSEGRRASVTVGAAGSAGTFLQIDDYNKGCD